MNRTRRTIAILAHSQTEALRVAHARGIPADSVLWPSTAGVLVNARELEEIIIPPTFASHPRFDELADAVRDRLNPSGRIVAPLN